MKTTSQTTPFHLVSPSPWPILASFQIFNLVFTTSLTFSNLLKSNLQMFVQIMILVLISWNWWRDIIRESTFESRHTKEVLNGMKMGMLLFIISEVFFFLSFFWAYLHSALSPDISIGEKWPCKGIMMFDPTGIPLINTMILLSSGVTLTVAHHMILIGKEKKASTYTIFTIILGIYFSVMQYIEYKEASFTIADSVYGSIFFMSTGFHGLHVLIGTTFLIMTSMRLLKRHMSSYHHFGFESAAWYWHFVDVVWLFLYIIFYWMGS